MGEGFGLKPPRENPLFLPSENIVHLTRSVWCQAAFTNRGPSSAELKMEKKGDINHPPLVQVSPGPSLSAGRLSLSKHRAQRTMGSSAMPMCFSLKNGSPNCNLCRQQPARRQVFFVRFFFFLPRPPLPSPLTAPTAESTLHLARTMGEISHVTSRRAYAEWAAYEGRLAGTACPVCRAVANNSSPNALSPHMVRNTNASRAPKITLSK